MSTIKSIPPHHQTFIKKVSEGITIAKAYQECIKKKSTNKSAMEAGSRLAKKYRKEIEHSRMLIQKGIEDAHRTSAAQEAMKSIMQKTDRMVLLTQIAKGDIEIPTKEIRFDAEQKKFVTIPIVQLPSHQARIKAIEELNKMDGSYAPQRIKADINAVGMDAVQEKYEG